MLRNDPNPHAGKSKQSIVRARPAAMNIMQALEILKTWLNLDATLTGEQVSLNRASFLLSEISYGKMHVGDNWHWVVPSHRNSDGTVRRDIHAYAEEVATENGYGARELVELIVRPIDLVKH